MADTYTLISSVTVGAGGASSIDFTSIPATYTDLLLKLSIRNTGNAVSNVDNNFGIRFNGSSASNYSAKVLYGTGSSAGSFSRSAATLSDIGYADGNNATANTFGNTEVYIPNYAGSASKSFSSDSVAETNASAVDSALVAGLWSLTNAINQVTITDLNGNNFAQYSTAYLYGIKNS